MPRKEKNNKNWNKHLIMLLPVTGAVVPKKTLQDTSTKNSLDFHLDIINKIDKLLAEHNLEPQPVDTAQTPSIVQTPPSIPIEPRPPLNKTLAHQEIAWESQIQQPQVTTQTIPEEFKTELTINPEFRFITRQELIDTLSQEQQSQKDHIEIIDVNAFAEENTTIQKNIDFFNITNQTDEIPNSFIINDVFNKPHHHKKIEIIDARTLKQKIYEDALNASAKQTEQIDNKAKLYFLNKSSGNKKQKKLETEQAYIPDDFEERWKKLKEKQSKDEENNSKKKNKINYQNKIQKNSKKLFLIQQNRTKKNKDYFIKKRKYQQRYNIQNPIVIIKN